MHDHFFFKKYENICDEWDTSVFSKAEQQLCKLPPVPPNGSKLSKEPGIMRAESPKSNDPVKLDRSLEKMQKAKCNVVLTWAGHPI